MDINALRNRLKQLNERTQKKSKDVWKAKDEHVIRLLPYPHGADPMIELHFHYDIGGQTVLCPKLNFNNPCVICDYCDALYSWKDADGNDKAKADKAEDWEIFKKIQPKVRMFTPMIERNPKDGTLSEEGPKFWGISPTSAAKILEICSNAERLEMVDASPEQALEVLYNTDKAFDLNVSFKDAAGKPLAKGNTKTFPVVDFESGMKAKPVSKDKAEIKKVLAAVKKISEVYPEQSSEEVKTIFDKFVGLAQKEAKPEGGVEKYGANTKEDAKIKGGKSIDEAFGDAEDADA